MKNHNIFILLFFLGLVVLSGVFYFTGIGEGLRALIQLKINN